MPAVSVLIPVYNVEPYLAECLDSVLDQTFQDFEIICVDDASTDQSLSILQTYARRDSRITVLRHDTNRGQSAGRNLALAHAAGEYVYMLDADDKLEAFALEELVRTAGEGRLDVIGFETRQFYDDPKLAPVMPSLMIRYRDTGVLNGRQGLVYCMREECFSLSTPTFFMRRAYLVEKGLLFVEGILHEDVGYLLELITKAERIRFLPVIYFNRRVRARSTMTTAFTARNIEGYMKSFYKAYELEIYFTEELQSDPDFAWALAKWKREIYWRMRQLYFRDADSILPQPGGLVSEEIRRAFETLKLSLGGLSANTLPAEEKVYLCGTGSYTERAISLFGQRDTQICGIIVTDKKSGTFRGFPVYKPEELPDLTIPAVLSISHYTRDDYRKCLEGKVRLIKMEF